MPVVQNDKSKDEDEKIDQLTKAFKNLKSDDDASGSESGCIPIQSTYKPKRTGYLHKIL